MKNNLTGFLRACCLAACVLLSATIAFAQTNTVKVDPDVDKHLAEIKNLLKDPSAEGNVIAGYAFNDSLQRFLRQVSGTVLKSGTIQSISAVADDKSLTVNYALPVKAKWWSFQLTGSGTASKGLINVFTGDKFGKTLTVGGTINKFLWGSAVYKKKKATDFKYYLKDARGNQQGALSLAESANNKLIDDLVAFKKTYADLFSAKPVDASNYTAHFKNARCLHQLLVKAKDFFPTDLDTTDYAKVGSFIDELNINRVKLVAYVRSVNELKVLDSLQTAAPFNHYRFIWLSLSPKLNQTNYPIYDPANADALYTRTESDYFFSAAGSANIMWSFKKFKFLLYPGVTVQNARVFDPKDSLSVSIHQPFAPGIDTVKNTGFYPSVAARKWVWGLNVPVMLYWTSGVGVDAGASFKFNPGQSYFSLHAGVFFTLPAAGETVTIEPLIRYEDDKTKIYARNFDKFSLGISLSLALPTFIKGSK